MPFICIKNFQLHFYIEHKLKWYIDVIMLWILNLYGGHLHENPIIWSFYTALHISSQVKFEIIKIILNNIQVFCFKKSKLSKLKNYDFAEKLFKKILVLYA